MNDILFFFIDFSAFSVRMTGFALEPAPAGYGAIFIE